MDLKLQYLLGLFSVTAYLISIIILQELPKAGLGVMVAFLIDESLHLIEGELLENS